MPIEALVSMYASLKCFVNHIFVCSDRNTAGLFDIRGVNWLINWSSYYLHRVLDSQIAHTNPEGGHI